MKTVFLLLTVTLTLANGVVAEDQRDVIVRGLEDRAFVRIEVFGAPGIDESFAAITSTKLRELAEFRIVIDPGYSTWKSRGLIAALSAAKPLDANQMPTSNGDYRWTCLLHSSEASNPHEVALDRLRNFGTIDGRFYSFGPRLRVWFYAIRLEQDRFLGLNFFGWTGISGAVLVAFLIFRTVRRRQRDRSV